MGARRGQADSIVVNTRVYTVEPGAPRAEAFAIKDGRSLAVGGNADIRALAGKGTRVFDAKKMTVLPGFIDCHDYAVG
jgi:predicted amidohydrolase YtcJ